MQLCAFYLIFLLNLINCAENTFKIDFSFFLPDFNITNNKENPSNELLSNLIVNQSINRNIEYYQNIKPMTDICIGEPLQCFLIPISFNENETVINLNSLNFNYKKSESFKLLPDLNISYGAVDIIKLSNRAKSLIQDYNFIITNESNILSNLSVLGLGRNRLYSNYLSEKDISFSLIKQLKDKKLIDSTEITIKYTNDFSGEIILGTNYTGMKIDESLFLELPNNENSLNGFLQSIYIEDTTINSKRKKHIDLLEKEKRKRISIDFNTTFIIFTEEIFDQLKTISFNSYINAGICDLKKEENNQISYLVCKNDILNSNLDKLFFMINHKKNIAINLNDLFLPYQDEAGNKNNIFGIISRNNTNDNDTISIGSVLLKKYMVVLNREKNSVRLYMKNIGGKVPTDFFGIGGIIALTTIIFILIIYMVTTICGKDKYEPNYSSKIKKFLNKKNLDTSMQSNESF